MMPTLPSLFKSSSTGHKTSLNAYRPRCQAVHSSGVEPFLKSFATVGDTNYEKEDKGS